MSKFIDFNSTEWEKHECHSTREGDWIVFECPQCDYTRRMNWKTGEMKVSGGEMQVLHSGTHLPTGMDADLLHSN